MDRLPAFDMDMYLCFSATLISSSKIMDDSKWKASYNFSVHRRHEFKEIERLKGGNYSKVFRVRCRFDGGEYIVKRSKHPVTDLAARRQCQQVCLHH